MKLPTTSARHQRHAIYVDPMRRIDGRGHNRKLKLVVLRFACGLHK